MIRSAKLFRGLASLSGLDRSLKPGLYETRRPVSELQALLMLQPQPKDDASAPPAPAVPPLAILATVGEMVPVIGPIVCPSLYGVKYASGVFYEEPTLMQVSRGISGEDSLRINCPPELTTVVLSGTKRRAAESQK